MTRRQIIWQNNREDEEDEVENRAATNEVKRSHHSKAFVAHPLQR